MTNYYQENVWREKSDEEIFKAVSHLEDYDKSVHSLIRIEAQRRFGLQEAEAPIEPATASSGPRLGFFSRFGCAYFGIAFFCIIFAIVGWFLALLCSWSDGSSGNSPGLSCLASLLLFGGIGGVMAFTIIAISKIIKNSKK